MTKEKRNEKTNSTITFYSICSFIQDYKTEKPELMKKMKSWD